MKKYPEEEIDNAIEKLKKYNYLNDERACKNQFEIMYNSKKYSVKQICYKLIQLGFDENLIESCKPEDFSEHDEIVAVKFLQTKFKSFQNVTDEKKLWIFLNGKGFDYSAISFAINKFKELI